MPLSVQPFRPFKWIIRLSHMAVSLYAGKSWCQVEARARKRFEKLRSASGVYSRHIVGCTFQVADRCPRYQRIRDVMNQFTYISGDWTILGGRNSEQVLFSVDCHSYPALILLRAGFADHGDSNHMQVAVFLFAGCLLHLSFLCRFLICV